MSLLDAMQTVPEHKPWTTVERLRLTIDPTFLFERVVGSPPDEWQRTLLTGVIAAAQDLDLSDRNWAICCSRQIGKSTCCSVVAVAVGCFAPAMIGRPVIVISPSDRQSVQMLLKIKKAVRALPRDRTNEIVSENQNELILRSGTSFIALPSGQDGATLRSFSGISLLLADEASNIGDSIFQATLPMLASSKGILALLSTPRSYDGDWFGRLHNTERPESGWTFISALARDCLRFAPETLSQLRNSLGAWRYKMEMENSFVAGGDGGFFDVAAVEACSRPIPTFRVVEGGKVIADA